MINDLLVTYARDIRDLRRAHPDVTEPALAPVFQRLLQQTLPRLPLAQGLAVVPEFQNAGVGRPDIALKRAGQPARAFIELKAPAKSADPGRWKGHDKRQAERFKVLANRATCNFEEFRLFEREALINLATVVPKAALDPSTSDARADAIIGGHDPQPFVTLLARLAQADAPSAANAEELAANLAYAARLVKGIVADRLAELKDAGTANHPLQQVRAEFRDVLYAHPEAGGYTGKSFDDLFAAAFAQTLAFGLLLVREGSGAEVDLNAAQHMPPEHPLMRNALQVLTLPQIVEEVGIGFPTMLDTVNSFAPELMAIQPGGRDPILYFYEDFLSVFDRAARERYGVYYTPLEVVRYMVGALDRALRDDLGTQGLRDPAVTLLDPAVGTGTFLLGVAERVRAAAVAAGGPGMARLALHDLAHRMFGFELLVGPYAVAHYRLHHALREEAVPGAPPPPPLPRLGVYLADTLARPGADAPAGALGFVAGGIREERIEANRIKTEQPILAIIGNPPYRRLEEGENETLVGRWMDELWDDLKQPVREAGWGNQLNTFPELSIAFWRWAMWKIFEADNAPRRGVVAFITNRKFITGKPYAGLRRMLRDRFDRIEIVDLRGDVRRGERAGVAADQGVFNIQVGTAITLAIADGSKSEGALAEVRYTDAWAAEAFSRGAKFAWLADGAATGTLPDEVEVSRDEMDDLRPEPFQSGNWGTLKDCFSFISSGLESKRDHVVYDFDRVALFSGLTSLLTDPIRGQFDFNQTAMNKYQDAQAVGVDDVIFRRAAYRPLDLRWHYPHRRFNDRLRTDLTRVWGQTNLCLFSLPAGTGAGPATWCYSNYPDRHAFRGSYGGYAFPLHDRRKGENPINLSPPLLAGLAAAYGAPVAPEDVFDAILALLSATSYTTRFAEDLEDVFPHVPFPADPAVFARAVTAGRDIRAVETFARVPDAAYLTPALARLVTSPTPGPLATVDCDEGAIVLRDDGSGRLEGVPAAVWQFAVSGYRLLPRWLAAREGQPVDLALVNAVRDLAGRIAELIDLFATADTVLADALGDTLARDALGLGDPVRQEDDDDGPD